MASIGLLSRTFYSSETLLPSAAALGLESWLLDLLVHWRKIHSYVSLHLLHNELQTTSSLSFVHNSSFSQGVNRILLNFRYFVSLLSSIVSYL